LTMYAWKITAPGQPGIERISTLDDLERFMDGVGLSGGSPPREIIDRTLIMEYEGQGFYRNDFGGSEWMLTWIKLGPELPGRQ
jgi:hypothetical protein